MFFKIKCPNTESQDRLSYLSPLEEAKRDKCKNMTLKINISTLIINKEVLSLTANSS